MKFLVMFIYGEMMRKLGIFLLCLGIIALSILFIREANEPSHSKFNDGYGKGYIVVIFKDSVNSTNVNDTIERYDLTIINEIGFNEYLVSVPVGEELKYAELLNTDPLIEESYPDSYL